MISSSIATPARQDRGVSLLARQIQTAQTTTSHQRGAKEAADALHKGLKSSDIGGNSSPSGASAAPHDPAPGRGTPLSALKPPGVQPGAEPTGMPAAPFCGVERGYPPIALVDTVKMTPAFFQYVAALRNCKTDAEKQALGPPTGVTSIHGQAEVFSDADIIAVHGRALAVEAGCGGPIARNEFGRAILQQQAQRGCTAAAAAMLLADHGKPIDWTDLRTTNLGFTGTMLRALGLGGLTAKVFEMPANLQPTQKWQELHRLVTQEGSAIIGVDHPKHGAHVVVVDSMSKEVAWARLRDPYHGWDITVRGDALLDHMPGTKEIICSGVKLRAT